MDRTESGIKAQTHRAGWFLGVLCAVELALGGYTTAESRRTDARMNEHMARSRRDVAAAEQAVQLAQTAAQSARADKEEVAARVAELAGIQGTVSQNASVMRSLLVATLRAEQRTRLSHRDTARAAERAAGDYRSLAILREDATARAAAEAQMRRARWQAEQAETRLRQVEQEIRDVQAENEQEHPTA